MQPPQDDKKQQRRLWLSTSNFKAPPPRQGGGFGSHSQKPPPQTPPQTRPRSGTEGATPPKVDDKMLAAALLEQFKAVHADFEKARQLNPDPDGALVQAHFAFRDAVQRHSLQEAAAALRKLKAEIRKILRPVQLTEDRQKVRQERANYVQQITARLTGRAKIIKGAAFQQGVAKKLEKELSANKNPSFTEFVKKLGDAETQRSPNSITALQLAAETAKQFLEGIEKPTPNDLLRLGAIKDALRRVRLWKLAEEQEALATMPEGPEKEHLPGALSRK